MSDARTGAAGAVDAPEALAAAASYRRWLFGTVAFGVPLLLFLVARLSLGGFLYGDWLWIGLILSALGTVGCILQTRSAANRVKRALGLKSDSELWGAIYGPSGALTLAMPTTSIVVVVTMLALWIGVLAVALPPVFAASALGTNPGRTRAVVAYGWHPCLRCSDRAAATFRTSDGEVVRAELTGVSQDLKFYKAGISVVYDPHNPRRAMATRDYDDGRGLGPRVATAASTALMVLSLLGAIWIRRRRRDAYCNGRPGVPVKRLTYRRAKARRSAAWRVEWADGRRAAFSDSASNRRVLRDRARQDGAKLDPGDEKLLGG
jgi:hypothetical protein